MPRARTLYFSPFVDELIYAERGLRSHNAAGSNRTLRLAQAMRCAGLHPLIISPAISLRAHRKGGALFHRGKAVRRGGVPVVYAPAFNIIGLNILAVFFFQLLVLRRIQRQPFIGVVLYNFAPSMVFLAIWITLSSGIRIINNIEDVSVASASDWSRQTEARPLQQLVYSITMRLIAGLGNAYVIPTRRFLSYLPKKRAEIVTGCIELPLHVTRIDPPPIRVLFAGKIEREHGIVQFVEALEALDGTPAATYLQVDISGTGNMLKWVAERLARLKTLAATQHGFIGADEYRALLGASHVCVALQDPVGRYADFKTPSKIYEFLGYGKAVIATDVGDVRDMPSDALVVLDRLDSAEIAYHLAQLVHAPETLKELQARAREHSMAHFSYEVVGRRLRRLFDEEIP